MANSKNLFASLTSELTTTSLITSSLFPSAGTQTGAELRPGANASLKPLSFTAKDVATGIQFGSPSSSRATATSSSGWTSILKQTLTGGASRSANGGSLSLLASVTGIGGLISGLSGILGSKNTPPPLTEFQLPQTQQQAISIGQPGSSTSASPIYQSAQIAQAVKQALLNSSSLNDVIAEI